MRDLDLLNQWLVLMRQRALQHGHMLALGEKPSLLTIKALAIQAEFCDRVREALGVLANNPDKFIKEYLP
jgi:hypothetical protein